MQRSRKVMRRPSLKKRVRPPPLKREKFLTAYQCQLSCPDRLRGSSRLHSLIKNKFTEIMGRYFQQIPDNENYWYHTLHDYDDCFLDRQYSSQSQPTTQDEVETSGTEFVGERDLLQAESLTKLTEPPHVENTSDLLQAGTRKEASLAYQSRKLTEAPALTTELTLFRLGVGWQIPKRLWEEGSAKAKMRAFTIDVYYSTP
ncbi:hypothetical protein BSL78_02182 [Apostichopus japonicus]|uniref:Uncharacterized protein n=1 Tax=Stichopus japonicus TaxID=307972 RepID=A0A2G8LKS6_STIJA|nr:hypothetical protein BSL78_02182 [Apostichopus japonicus]